MPYQSRSMVYCTLNSSINIEVSSTRHTAVCFSSSFTVVMPNLLAVLRFLLLLNSIPASRAFKRTRRAAELFRSTNHSLLSNQVTSISHPIHRFVFYHFQEHAKVRIDQLVNQANWPPLIISFSSSLELI